MKLQVVEQDLYRKAHKKLSKQYRHLQNDIDNFLDSIGIHRNAINYEDAIQILKVVSTKSCIIQVP